MTEQQSWPCCKCEGGLPSAYTYYDKPLCTACANKMRFGSTEDEKHYTVQEQELRIYDAQADIVDKCCECGG